MELGQEGKGRCGWQSRGAGPLFGRMAPAEDLGLQRVSLSPRGPDKVCPACCGGVGVGQGVGEEGAGKEPLTGHSKHWGPFHLLRSQLMPDKEWPGPPCVGTAVPGSMGPSQGRKIGSSLPCLCFPAPHSNTPGVSRTSGLEGITVSPG